MLCSITTPTHDTRDCIEESTLSASVDLTISIDSKKVSKPGVTKAADGILSICPGTW